MPSLNLDLDYFSHPKILRLVAKLGDAGFLMPIRLWCYVGKHHADTGKLAGYSKEEIEQIVGWRGTAGQCVEALLEVKLLDRTRAHKRNMRVPQNAQKRPESYAVHDWAEHAGHLVYYKQRAKSAANARWGKLRQAANPDASSMLEAMPLHLISSHPTTHKDDECARQDGNPVVQSDEQWLSSLKENPSLKGIDIDHEFRVAQAWVAGSESRKQKFTRKFFLQTWLVNAINKKRPIEVKKDGGA
jgi:hypothetical protein